MTSEAPDPRGFKSWEEAFQYPVPTVRGMEKKLRNNINENHDKLRTLVGGSYRDLLGTARTIIEINDQMHDVENLLASASRKSDSRIVDKLAKHRSQLEQQYVSQDRERLARAAQVSTLKSCLTAVKRSLQTDGSTLLAAKLLVLARLLHKTLSSQSNAPSSCLSLGSKLVSLRQMLLRHIDRRATHPNIVVHALVENMTAFSLATSSAPSAAFTHFLHLRADAITKSQDSDEKNVQASIIRRLDMFVGTLRLSKTVFPDLLSASLRTLGAGPILSDSSVVSIEELNLDLHERWFSDEDRKFTPWPRHDELQKSKTMEMIQGWSRSTLEGLVSRISEDLSTEEDCTALASTRKDVLQTWLSSRRYAYGLSTGSTLIRLRSPFLERQKTIIEKTLTGFGSTIQRLLYQTVEDWNEGSPDVSVQSLWDPSIMDESIADGANRFKQVIIDRRNGRSTIINSLINTYEHHANTIEEVQAVLKAMRDVKWDDDYDDDDDDPEITEDDRNSIPKDQDSDSVWQTLSRSDPEQLSTALRSSVNLTFNNLQSSLTAHFQPHPPSCTTRTSPGIFLLRALRELRARTSCLLLSVGPAASTSKSTFQPHLFCADLIKTLHTALADSIETRTSPALSESLTALSRKKLQIRVLWDGNPPLPTQPSPATFKYLRVLVKEMAAMGQDVWTPDVVTLLKMSASQQARSAFESAVAEVARQQHSTDAAAVLDVDAGGGGSGESEKDATSSQPDEGADDETTNAARGNEMSATDPSTEEERKEERKEERDAKLTQLRFDRLYLSHALSTRPHPGPSAPRDTTALFPSEAGKPLDEESERRLQKNAAEYWRRTCLLFGLLSG